LNSTRTLLSEGWRLICSGRLPVWLWVASLLLFAIMEWGFKVIVDDLYIAALGLAAFVALLLLNWVLIRRLTDFRGHKGNIRRWLGWTVVYIAVLAFLSLGWIAFVFPEPLYGWALVGESLSFSLLAALPSILLVNATGYAITTEAPSFGTVFAAWRPSMLALVLATFFSMAVPDLISTGATALSENSVDQALQISASVGGAIATAFSSIASTAIMVAAWQRVPRLAVAPGDPLG
jgi:hypothetical protein